MGFIGVEEYCGGLCIKLANKCWIYRYINDWNGGDGLEGNGVCYLNWK